MEQDLFARRRDLLTGLDLVLFDTTSAYFHDEDSQTLGWHGKSKAHRPQCKLVILGLTLDSEECPLCTEIWPGNTVDVTALLPEAGRGMISKKTIQALEERDWGYVLGCRLRNVKECREKVLPDAASEVPLLV